jgi:hypothetical protein
MGLHDDLWKLGLGRVVPLKSGLSDRAIFDKALSYPWQPDFVKPSFGAGLRRLPREAWIVRGKARRLVTEGKGLDWTIEEFHARSLEYKKAVEEIGPQEKAFKARLVAEAVEQAPKGREGRNGRQRARFAAIQREKKTVDRHG